MAVGSEQGGSLVVVAEARSNRPRVRGLDGIRAFAVLAVLGSHTAGTGMPGGYFGVDAFFALSGFLITSLLVEEFQDKTTISLLGFWARRARRLLPALFFLIIALAIVVAVSPSLFGTPDLRGDGLSTVFYFANWHLIASHTNYFVATGAPSPLLHTWSLAIEEQFYLVWPLVVLAVLGIRRRSRTPHRTASDPARMRRRLGALLGMSVAGAVASALWMGLSVTPFDTVRAYYGSDTRAQSLLAGAALAIAFALWGVPRSRRARRVLSVVGLAAAGGTAALWMFVPDTAYLAFHGGFLLEAIATCAVITSVLALPRGALALGLGLRPVRYLGRISYGMYLWYLPVALVLSPRRTHLNGYALFGARFVVITAIAALSAVLLENPIRRGAITSWKLRIAAPLAAGVSVMSIFAASVLPAEAGTARVTTATAHVAPPPAPAPVGPPIKVLLVGDSMAGSLGVGMSQVAPQYNALVADEGIPGCSIAIDKQVVALTFAGAPQPPCQAGNPQALFDGWRSWVDAWNPDVVLYFARGETLNTQIGSSSSWQHIGQPAFDARLSGRIGEALQVLGSRGAHVFLLGSPVYDSAAAINDQASPSGAQGSPFQEDDPARVTTDDALMQSAVADDPSATFVDVGAWLTPGGRYTSSVDGVVTRCSDGVHLTPAAGGLVASQLFPMVTTLAREHQQQSPLGTWPEATLPGQPAWYSKLHC